MRAPSVLIVYIRTHNCLSMAANHRRASRFETGRDVMGITRWTRYLTSAIERSQPLWTEVAWVGRNEVRGAVSRSLGWIMVVVRSDRSGHDGGGGVSGPSVEGN